MWFGYLSTGGLSLALWSQILIIFVSYRPDIRMVDKLRVGQVFMAGGQFYPVRIRVTVF